MSFDYYILVFTEFVNTGSVSYVVNLLSAISDSARYPPRTSLGHDLVSTNAEYSCTAGVQNMAFSGVRNINVDITFSLPSKFESY